MDQTVDRSDIEAALAIGPGGRGGKRLLRRAALLILVVGAMAGAYFAYDRMSGSDPGPIYVTEPAETGDITITVTATGTLQPLIQVDVSSELSGVIRTVEVEENQRVAKGQVLATLDTTRLNAQVERAQASVMAAQARIREAQTTLKETELTFARSASLRQRGMIADQTLETAEAARDRAESGLATAEANLAIAVAELKQQEAELAKSTIYAPIDGMVMSRSADPGQTVASSLSAPVLFVIAADLKRMQLEAAIDEADIGAVEKGQRARFTVDAFPERRFDAEIRDLAYAAATTEGVVTYQAKLTVANDELLLRPGMTATVSVVTREIKDAVTVPSAAFRFRPPVAAPSSGFSLQNLFMPPMRSSRPPATRQAADGTRTLYVLGSDGPDAVRVRTGATDGERTEILSGVKPGDKIITGLRQARR